MCILPIESDYIKFLENIELIYACLLIDSKAELIIS